MKHLRPRPKSAGERLGAQNSEKVSTKSEHTPPSVRTNNSERSPNYTLASSGQKHLLRYWEEAIYQRRAGGNWWIQIQHDGRRERFSLGTPVRSAAAEKARSIYLALASDGWERVLSVYRPEKVANKSPSIGEFLDELAKTADIKPKTLAGYSQALRKIVADSFGIEGGKAKFDYRNGGRKDWLEKIHAIRLARLTPAVVQQWKRTFLARAGDDPIKQRAAKISVNSFLRRAKSIFAPDAIRHLTLELPSPLPLEGVSFEPRQSMRYRSTIDAGKLTRTAQKELALKDPPAFLAFLLALGAGLRRIEIDRLEWAAFRFSENVIRIEPTIHFEVKTEHSIGDVKVDAELMALFRGYAARALSNFVIETPNLPRTRATFENYRAQAVFERLAAWLRTKGVSSRKPIHELRKEFGSMVNRKHGLSAAKDLLRHADIAITASHYIDSPREATSGLGALLAESKRKGKKIVEFKDAGRARKFRRSRRA